MFIETIKIDKQVAYHLDYHEQRIQKALHSITATPFFSLQKILIAPNNTLLRAKVSYDANTYKVEYFNYTPRKVDSLQLLTCKPFNYAHKYANRTMLESLFQLRGSADDILIVHNNVVKDTSIANIAFFDGEKWFTPREPLLEGTTRARLLDEGLLHVRDITPSSLHTYQKFALMNAMIGFHQVSNGIIKD